MMKPDAWMPLYIGDYLADTMGLSKSQHGSYLLTIMAYWRNGGPLDDATARAILGKDANALERFFHVENGLWHHKRIDQELATACALREKQLARTAAATASRRNSDQRNDERNDERNDDVTTNVTRSSSPSPSPSQVPDGTFEAPPGVPPRSEIEVLDAKQGRGRRLSADWRPGPEGRAYAERRGFAGPALDDLAANFVDYWTNGKGRNQAHIDWEKTWQRWVRTEDSRRVPRSAGPDTSLLAAFRAAGARGGLA